MRTDDPAPYPQPRAPLVSIIVRSMGRPELRFALQSIARQRHPAIDAIVVDATGGRHPPLPPLHWLDGHTIRVVSRPEPLKRPAAATLGLESARGDWFMFLDDDDTCDPEHVSTLIAAARAHPEALVVYGCGRLCDAKGHVQQVFGRPFNRALMHYGPLFYWQSALISTRVRELGCQFDPALEVCEDRDFLSQIAEHGDFVFVPAAATFYYRPDLGTSGTGSGANRDAARVARFENLLRAKWAGQGTFHNERAAARCRNGVRAYFARDLDGARRAFERVLVDYPDDPNALHGLARVAQAQGDIASAERDARKAIEINPAAIEYRTTLAAILAAAGPATASGDFAHVSRVASCPCGSGRRYKACCGHLGIGAPVLPAALGPPDLVLERAQREVARGEAQLARALLQPAVEDPSASRPRLLAAARLDFALDAPARAFDLLQRAAAAGVDAELGLMLDACCERLADSVRCASLWKMVARVSARSSAPRTPRSPRPVIRIAGHFPAGSARLRQAVELRDLLAEAADVALVADGESALFPEIEPTHGAAPATTLVLFEPVETSQIRADAPEPERVVVRVPRDDPQALLRCLARLQDTWPHSALQFTLPHAHTGCGHGQDRPVEYPWIDPALFAIAAITDRETLVVGRHGPAAPGDDHPSDGALYRGLMADGHHVRLPVTPFLRDAFREDPPAASPELTGELSAVAALQGLDVVVFRGGHDAAGSDDARVLEAMAAARPVVAFAHSVGAREWIVDARTGFVVQTEEAMRRRVGELAAAPSWRREIGLAARQVARAAMDAQRPRARAFYLGVSLNV